ncbi:MAG: glucose 1-dehydrogenase [Rhodospirillaceae bacterium]|nr:glucose 1-dehydrogenase [Rhodospirillaceae bacterium]MCA8934553.1 glucose 1-dehydrogenase [Rhodospirillaceae bacterium]
MILDAFRLDGRTGIVTGGGSGIGKAIARGLAEAGANVVIAGRDLARLEEVAASINSNAPGCAVAHSVDVADTEALQALVDATVDRFGHIDFLFNNAGTIHRAPAQDFPRAAWEHVIQVNLSGPFYLSQMVARVMIAQGRKGKIVNTSSLIAVQGGKNVVAYAATKAALTQVTRAMCNDLAKYNILVNAIGPGWVETEMTGALRDDPTRYAEITGRIPLGRWARPEELAGAAVFLASDASDYVTGQVLFVDGGWLSA